MGKKKTIGCKYCIESVPYYQHKCPRWRVSLYFNGRDDKVVRKILMKIIDLGRGIDENVAEDLEYKVRCHQYFMIETDFEAARLVKFINIPNQKQPPYIYGTSSVSIKGKTLTDTEVNVSSLKTVILRYISIRSKEDGKVNDDTWFSTV